MAKLPSAALLLLISIPLFGQAPSGRLNPEQRYKLFQDYLIRRASEVTRSFPGDIKTLADWKRRRPEILKQYLYVLGLDPMPAKTPLQARVTGQFERDTYRVEKVVFQSMPGLYVTGNLYVPTIRTGRLPAVLYLCGHSPGPQGAKVRYQHHGIWWARHGYLAFLIDTIEFGEVPGIHHGTHDLEMWEWLSLGYTPAGPEVWNAIRAMDYLETRPEVDPKKVALTGISGGGAITWYTAAADERFQVAAPVCSTWTVEHHTRLDAVHENCDCIYFVNTFLADLPVVGALIAPRPLKMLSARRDSSFPIAGYKEVYQRARPIYELYGAGDKIAEYDHDAPHSDIPAFRKEANEWINRWIRNDLTPFDEGQIQREELDTLKVIEKYPPDAVNGYVEKPFLKPRSPRPSQTLAAWKQRRARVLAEIKDKALRGFPVSKSPFNVWKAEAKVWTSNYSNPYYVQFDTEQGVRVNAELMVPKKRKASEPVLIYVKGRQDIVYPIDYDPLLGVLGTHVVLTLEPRMVNYPIDIYRNATIKRTAALIGATVESMQIWDVLRSIDYLKEVEGINPSSISLYARKEMAVPALYAAALDERVSRVILDNPPASHWQGPAVLNALRFTDLAEVAAIVAPREIVSLTALPEAYGLTKAVYGLYEKNSGVRRAYALADALKVWQYQGAAASPDYRKALALVGAQLEKMCALAGSGYPDYTVNGKWRLAGPSNWTAGYFAGMLWLMYGETKDPVWLERARRWTEPIGVFRHEKRDLNFGLSFMPAFVAGHRLTKDAGYRQTALDAANSLAARYLPSGNYIRSWGTVGNPKQQEMIIIDCLIDLDLLYWASQQTGDKKFSGIATGHTDVTVDTAIRADGSSVQVIELDPQTGKKVADRHKQGVSPQSCWSRGHAFAIYSLADVYRFTGEARFLEAAERLAAYWIKHVPEDSVPYWDFNAPGIPNEPRDSSAAAMAAGGFWKLSKVVKDGARAQRYRTIALRTLDSLTERYMATGDAIADGRILLHATLHKPAGLGIDVSMILGDYYYLELLLNLMREK